MILSDEIEATDLEWRVIEIRELRKDNEKEFSSDH